MTQKFIYLASRLYAGVTLRSSVVCRCVRLLGMPNITPVTKDFERLPWP